MMADPKAKESETCDLAGWLIGESYFHQEEFDRALSQYDRVAASGKSPRWQAASLLQGGKCLTRLGRWNEAAEHFERVTRDFPRSEFASDAAQRLRAGDQLAKRPR